VLRTATLLIMLVNTIGAGLELVIIVILRHQVVPSGTIGLALGAGAVELHPGRAALLRRRFPMVTVVQADAVSLPLPGRPFRVVASPPYGITAGLRRR